MLRKRTRIALLLTQCISFTAAFQSRQHLTKRQSRQDYTGYLVPTYNISIPVDHFNESDTRTYDNRYWVNDTYYQPGGPVFFFDNGEIGISEQWAANTLAEVNYTSAVVKLAEQYNGVVVALEHRYYGLSQPIPINISTHEPENGLAGYRYLTLDQSLEDVVYFANNWKPEGCDGDACTAVSPSNTPWIWVGGSYSGNRGAFARIRNPETIYAVWASSAPVQARYSGAPYYSPILASMPQNCSYDVRAAVAYADVIMTGREGETAFADLQRLTLVAGYTQYGLNQSYDLNDTDDYDTFTIGNLMAYVLRAYFQYVGPTNTTDLFCTYLESYNPNGTPSNTTDPYIAILSNPGDGPIYDHGLASSYNESIALQAYFYAWRKWFQYFHDVLILDALDQQSPPDLFADQFAWQYQVLTEYGWYQGSDVDNITIVSSYYNTTAIHDNLITLFNDDDATSFIPETPNITAFNQYGGWNMTPSNVMFTDGEFDPWRGGTLMSEEVWIDAPLRSLTTEPPKCGEAPQGSDIYGIVYPGSHHVPDQVLPSSVPFDENSPLYQGLELFKKALDAWVPCFNGTSSG